MSPAKPPKRCPGCNVLPGRTHLHGCTKKADKNQVPLELGPVTGCPHSSTGHVCAACLRLIGGDA